MPPASTMCKFEMLLSYEDCRHEHIMGRFEGGFCSEAVEGPKLVPKEGSKICTETKQCPNISWENRDKEPVVSKCPVCEVDDVMRRNGDARGYFLRTIKICRGERMWVRVVS